MTGNGSSPLICDAELDTNGLDCPLPLLEAELRLNRLPNDGALRVITTDAGSQRSFRAFAQLASHGLLREGAAKGVCRYWLRRR